MSNYRSYQVPWNKGRIGQPCTGSSSSKSDSTSSKYDSTYSKSSSDAKSGGSFRMGGPKYTTSTNQREGKYSSDVTSRFKEAADKRDPSSSYRPMLRTGAKSRDPSAEKETEKSSSGSHSFSRLYPPSSVPKYTGRLFNSKDDIGNKLKPTSRTTSREELDSGAKKYITSRFLPKNAVEKSHTAYSRPSVSRSISSQRETSRKNRELLNLISVQNEAKTSTSASRCSVASDDVSNDNTGNELQSIESEGDESENVLVISRETSPTFPNQSHFLKIRRLEMTRHVEKQVKRDKGRITMDRQTQSDVLEDSPKYARFGNTCATPWSSYLDMKFSSPENTKLAKEKMNSHQNSPTNLFRNNSSRFLNTSSKCDPKSASTTNLTTADARTKLPQSKKLPPQIPGLKSAIQNKDFRKSILNMNPDGKTMKVKTQRSSSISSAESEVDVHSSEATDVSENLSSCRSFHKTASSSSVSKLPKRTNSDASVRNRRSNTQSPNNSEATSAATTSGSDDETKSKIGKCKKEGKLRKRQLGSSRTSLIVCATEESPCDKAPKPPMSPRLKGDSPKNDEAKSFLMRALAPVTNLFKIKHQDNNNERADWLESNSENANSPQDLVSFPENSIDYSKRAYETSKATIRHIESGERAWWLKDSSDNNEVINLPVRRTGSEEQDWWLSSEPSKAESSDSKVDADFQNSHNASEGTPPWWLDDNADVPDGVKKYDESEEKSDGNVMTPEYLQKYKIRHIDSGERAWWLSSSENIPEDVVKVDKEENEREIAYPIRHQDSGEKAWWLYSDGGTSETSKKHSVSSDSDNDLPLGDRASPEGLEMPKDSEVLLSQYGASNSDARLKRSKNQFISRHTNIDDILGGNTKSLSPIMDRIFGYHDQVDEDEDCEQINPDQVKIHDSTPQHGVLQPNRLDAIQGFSKSISDAKLDDAALQLYKDGDYSSYLDLEASISEQQEEFEGFQSNKKNSIVLRTQLSVRVHTIIEKLLNSEGRELRRALFSLKQIFQEDKDLVHEFVQNDGLTCLIKVGSLADQNYQNYILRALGQVMLYVDGMNGVIQHNETIQWLYSLISSKFRLVVKTALKLLLVFVEYTDANCLLLIRAVQSVDFTQGLPRWYNVMKLLKDFDSADTELLIYAMTLVNKCLNGIPDQDTYYDQTDALEEQGIEAIIQRYMSKPGTDLDLLQQFQIYEAVLQYEDGEEKGIPLRHLDESVRKTLRNRKSMVASTERRKSRRHSTGTAPAHSTPIFKKNVELQALDDDESSSSQSSNGLNDVHLNGSYKENNNANDAGVTPALRRRRERAERQRSFMREQQETVALLQKSTSPTEENNEKNNGNYTSTFQQRLSNGNLNRNINRKDMTPLMNAVNKLDSEENHSKQQPWILSMMYNGKTIEEQNLNNVENIDNANENDRNVLLQLQRDNNVKDLTQKLSNQSVLLSPTDESKLNRIGDMSGLISKAKEGLAKSKSKADVLKSPTSDNIPKIEVKKSENELRWEELVKSLRRPLNLCDIDFTDLGTEDEIDVLAPTVTSNGVPPPPPPMSDMSAPPPPPLNAKVPPPVPNPPVFGVSLHRTGKVESKIPIKKNKKTVKLFWKEVREDAGSMKFQRGLIWDELATVTVDTQKLEHLFESRAKDLITKKQQEMNKNKEIIVLDPKRSNAINIGMTKLPPPRSIKTAILKMDATIMNREGIEKLLTMLPTEEERTKIQEAQAANPDLPLGSAEQFLLTLASISELPARLKLWAFKLDFENSEREIAEPLYDLKQGFEVLRYNKTFRGVLSTLLSIGIFLNGAEVKGFQIEYLAKVPEVKDTVHKHSLLHHLCHIVMEKFPDATDLYSEIGAITRASKIDFDELALNIQRLESDCKASWDHLKLIAKHDGSTMMKIKMSDFLADCAERIILLGIIHRRVMNRFYKFLLWLGIPLHQVSETKPNEFCRVISEFALEYRTTRERVLQQLEKKANHRERNKTRGKMITEIGKFRTKEDRADAELRQLLGNDISDGESMKGTLPWRRRSRDTNRSFLGQMNGNLTDGDDEILESLVKTATKGPARNAPRERKRTRQADRKSLRRTLKNGLSEEEKNHLSAYIKSY